MDRYWFLTNTCYGTWLPGDDRGFVGHVFDHREEDDDEDNRIVHNQSNTPYDESMPHLKRASAELLRGPPILLEIRHAEVLLAQFRETARFRGWTIEAAAIMANHWHLVVGVIGDPIPGKILGDFKSWGTRTLSLKFGAPKSETWWTENGSKRRVKNRAGVERLICYVLYEQEFPLIRYSPETGIMY